MKPHFIVFALIACGAGLSAFADWPTHPADRAQFEQQVNAVQLDLVALQRQADAALDNLRRAQRSRQTPAGTSDQRYSLLVPSQ